MNQPGDTVTFAGGKYTVVRTFSDLNVEGVMTDYVVIANGWQIPLGALNTASSVPSIKINKIEAARQKLMAQLQRQREKEAREDAKPLKKIRRLL